MHLNATLSLTAVLSDGNAPLIFKCRWLCFLQCSAVRETEGIESKLKGFKTPKRFRAFGKTLVVYSSTLLRCLTVLWHADRDTDYSLIPHTIPLQKNLNYLCNCHSRLSTMNVLQEIIISNPLQLSEYRRKARFLVPQGSESLTVLRRVVAQQSRLSLTLVGVGIHIFCESRKEKR